MSLRNKSARLVGIEPKKITQLKFFKLAKRLRKTINRKDTKGLGDALGRMVFGK
jgi:hypothetical protein